jgi:hypothetical protein
VQNLLVHFTHRQHPDQPLRPGVQRIVRHASGSVRLGGDAAGTLLLAAILSLLLWFGAR